MTAGKGEVTPERLLRMMWDFGGPLIISSAVRTGIFDALADGPKTIEETATRSGLSQRGVRSILNALVGFGFVAKDDPQHYRLSPEADAFLVSTRPGYLGGMFGHARELLQSWLDLPEIIRTGRPAQPRNEQDHGVGFFRELVGPLFTMNLPSAQRLGKELHVSETTRPLRLLDIAAGSGVWGIAVAQQSPQVSVTALDWPGVLEVTREFAARFDLADRFSYIGGDLNSVDFGNGYNIATLGHILHSEGAPRSRKLLRKTYDALAPGGQIAIGEFLVNNDRTGPPIGLIFGVNMLVHTEGGDTFSFEEINGWLSEVGFRNVRQVDPGAGPATLVLAQKPEA
jgi:SAM-dependent methyltransferase